MDEINTIYDSNNMHGSIHGILKQITHSLTDQRFNFLNPINIPIHEVVIVGMGSSLIAYKLVSSLYESSFRVPIVVVNNSNLPPWADKNTLVILSSYSGNSVETISCAESAVKQQCIIIGITTGSKLLDIIKDYSYFIYKIDPNLYNPCQQPRMSIGFSFGAYLKVLQKLNVLFLSEDNQQKILKTIRTINLRSLENKAKIYSSSMRNRYITVASGGFLSGNAELLYKQMNWNAKQYASLSFIPEAMHHTCEGIWHPKKLSKSLFVIITSLLLEKSEYKDLDIIIQYLKEMNVPFIKIDTEARTKIKSVINTIILSSYIAFYLSMYYKQNPTPTPAIDYYKVNYKKKG